MQNQLGQNWELLDLPELPEEGFRMIEPLTHLSFLLLTLFMFSAHMMCRALTQLPRQPRGVNVALYMRALGAHPEQGRLIRFVISVLPICSVVYIALLGVDLTIGAAAAVIYAFSYFRLYYCAWRTDRRLSKLPHYSARP